MHIARTYRGRKQNFTGESFRAKGRYVSTAGRGEESIKKCIRGQEVEDKRLDQLELFGEDKIIYADNGYVEEEAQACIPAGVKNQIHEKRKRNKPLTKKREKENKAKSHIRVRVGHVFGMIQYDWQSHFVSRPLAARQSLVREPQVRCNRNVMETPSLPL